MVVSWFELAWNCVRAVAGTMKSSNAMQLLKNISHYTDASRLEALLDCSWGRILLHMLHHQYTVRIRTSRALNLIGLA